MVKKLVTGLAISVGAGLAFAATTRTTRKGPWHPATSDGTMTPVSIRVHTAVQRSEQMEAETTAVVRAADHEIGLSQLRSAELAEIKVMIEALDHRSNDMMTTVNQRIDDLQSHLPRFIDVKVTSRVREVEERLRSEFQDEQSKTLDAFLGTLEHKILPRLSLVENAVGAQGAELGLMRDRIEKTDDALDRVLNRIEKAVDTMMTPIHSNSYVTQIHQRAVA